MTARVCQIQIELCTIALEDCTIVEYCLHTQCLVNTLNALGELISKKEHFEIVLEGLPEEYTSAIGIICSRFDDLNIEDVESLLVEYESQLDKFHKKTLATVNLVEANPNNKDSSSAPQANMV